MRLEPPRSRFRGHLDGVRDGAIRGWVAPDPDRPGAVPRVRIIVNGAFVGTASCNVYRVDLAEAGILDGCCAFAFAVPERIATIETLDAIVEGTDITIAHSEGFAIEPERLPALWEGRCATYALPSFFLLGAARCGTTALHEYLYRHSEICMSVPKEPLFFEAEYELGATYYFRTYFPHWNGETIVGEARHRNLYLPQAAPRIAAYNPDARFIAIVRNPIERAISHWWFWYSRGRDPLTFRDAIDLDLQRIAREPLVDSASERVSYARGLTIDSPGPRRTYVDSGHYAEQLQRYANLFGRDRLLVLTFEEFARDTARVLGEVCRFVGADGPCPAGLDPIQFSASRDGARYAVDRGTVEKLVEHYRPHNARLGAMLSRSFDHWDRP